MSLYTQASNGKRFDVSGVDPSTGLYSHRIPLATISALDSDDNAVSRDFSISYNCMSASVNSGFSPFGNGWNMDGVSTMKSSTLTLSNGKSFQSTGFNDGNLTFADRKTVDFDVVKTDDGMININYKDGVVEVLSEATATDYYLYMMIFPNGEAYYFNYAMLNNVRALNRITDTDQNNILEISYNGGYISSAEVWTGDATKMRCIVAQGANVGNTSATKLTYYTQFSDDIDSAVDQVNLTYTNAVTLVEDYMLLNEATSSRGSSESIAYGSPHQCNTNGSLTYVPRVSTYTANPGAEQPQLCQTFHYPDNGVNFLGYPNSYSYQNYADCIYNWATASAYQYWVNVKSFDAANSTPTKDITSYYNAFHLQTKETVLFNGCAEDSMFYYPCDDEGNGDLLYIEQPANLLNANKVERKFYKIDVNNVQVGDSGTYTSTFVYDQYGNQTSTTDPSGQKQSTEYYPVAGDGTNCPPDPFNAFQRFLKTSAKSSADGDISKVKTFTYQNLAGVSGDGANYISNNVKPLTMTFGDGTSNIISVTMAYNATPDQRFTHNQFSKATFTITGSDSNDYTSTCDFTNTLDGAHLTKKKTITAHDGTTFTYSKTSITFSNLVISTTDRQGITNSAVYHNTGKPKSVTNYEGTPYESTQTFTYEPRTENGGPKITMTESTGVQQRLLYDGSGNIVAFERSLRNSLTEAAPESPADPPVFYTMLKNGYDEYGRNTLKTESDYTNDGTVLYSSTTTVTYDGWGFLADQISSDGVIARAENNPMKLSQKNTLVIEDGDGVVTDQLASLETVFNTSKKPLTKTMTRTDAAMTTFTTAYSYDGIGRATSITSPLSQTIGMSSFDILDRVQSATDPIGRNLSVEYSSSSPKNHTKKISLVDDNGTVLNVLGEQEFDGIGRRTSQTVGGRTSTAEFNDSMMEPNLITTPAGNTIDFSFNPNLHKCADSITEYLGDPTDGSVQATNTFTYENNTKPGSCRKLSSTTNGSMTLSSSFTTDGQKKDEICNTTEGVSGGTVNNTCTLLGKPLSQTLKTPTGDVSVSYSYDPHGRVLKKTQGDVVVQYVYDKFGRLNSETVSTTDGTVQQTTTVELDDLNRETKRTIKAGSSGDEHSVSSGYDNCNKMTSREVALNGTSKLKESFTFDLANRMTEHSIDAGYDSNFLPIASFGNKFTSQTFEFNNLDNITKVTTVMPDGGGTNEATFSYDETSNTLSSITNTSQNFPTTVSFSYDADGNLTTVDKGSSKINMTHSVSGRLLSYEEGSEVTTFKYDALQRLFKDNSRTRLISNGLVFAESETVDGAQIVTEYVRSGTHVVAEKSASETVYVGTDRQLSAITSYTDGTTMKTTSYSSYGCGETPGSRTGYCGELKMGSIYALGNGTRYFLPDIQMFVSPDGFAPFSQGGINPYLYCRGDPLNTLDPTGHFGVGLDLGLNIFSFIIDAIEVGLAVASIVATGGATAPAVIGLAGAIFGVTSDVLGIAGDSMAIQDSNQGTDRSTTITNLGIASAAFGVAAMATGGIENTPSVQKRGGNSKEHYDEMARKNRDKKADLDTKHNTSEVGDMWPELQKKSDKYDKKAGKYEHKAYKGFVDELNDTMPLSTGGLGWGFSTFAGLDFDSMAKTCNSLNPTRRRVKYGAWAATEFIGNVAGFALLGNFADGMIHSSTAPPVQGSDESGEAGPVVDDGNVSTMQDSLTNGYPLMDG